jgi:hypothetical protein
LGARVEGVEQQEGVATVTSRAGQKTTTKQHSDALWYLTLSEEEMTALSRAVAQAETNLAKVQANVAKLGTASSK